MKVNRTYGAIDNNVNTEMTKIMNAYCNKNNLKIVELNIFEYAISFNTECKRNFNMCLSQQSGFANKNISNYIYFKETINKKQIRIKKENW